MLIRTDFVIIQSAHTFLEHPVYTHTSSGVFRPQNILQTTIFWDYLVFISISGNTWRDI